MHQHDHTYSLPKTPSRLGKLIEQQESSNDKLKRKLDPKNRTIIKLKYQ